MPAHSLVLASIATLARISKGWVSIMVKPLIAAVIAAGLLTGCAAGRQASANSASTATCHLGIVAKDKIAAGQYGGRWAITGNP